MNVVVVGGTGTVGSELVRTLLAHKASVRVLTRRAEKSGTLPPGAEAAVGDLRRPSTLPLPFRGAEAVFILNALSEDESEQGLAAVEAACQAGARRIVYLSVQNADGARHIPHFATKLPVEEAVRDCGVEWTILRPNNYFQNDLALRDAIVRHGVYPQPIGSVGVSRVDVRDIAEAAAKALCEPGHSREVFTIAGPRPLTGDDVAAVYSKALGREVRYGGDDLEAWSAQARTVMPEWLVHDLRIMYEHFQREGLVAGEEELDRMRALLGREPRGFESFVGEIASAWKRVSAAG